MTGGKEDSGKGPCCVVIASSLPLDWDYTPSLVLMIMAQSGGFGSVRETVSVVWCMEEREREINAACNLRS